MDEKLERAVRYSIALCPTCFKWKMLSFSGPKDLIFLQLLIDLTSRSAVNVCAISKDFLAVLDIIFHSWQLSEVGSL